MAKKNSTKTATKEAMQASEPRFQAITGWKGINLSEAPANWQYEGNQNSQTDLEPNFLLVQNNVVSTDLGTLETRPKDSVLFDCSNASFELTGVSYIKGKWLYLVYKLHGRNDYGILAHDVTDSDNTSYQTIEITYNHNYGSGEIFSRTSPVLECKFTCIYSYLNDEQEYLLVLGKMSNEGGPYDGKCVTFVGPIDTVLDSNGGIENSVMVDAPTTKPAIIAHDVIPNQVAIDFWQTMITYATSLVSDGPMFEAADFRSYEYGGMISSYSVGNNVVDSNIIKENKWYLDENNSMYLRASGRGAPGLNVYRFDYSINTDPSSGVDFIYALWQKAMDDGNLAFNRAWAYQLYKDVTQVPSYVAYPNEWKSDPTNINLGGSSSVAKLAKNAFYVGADLIAPNPDSDYGVAYRYMDPTFDNDFISGLDDDYVRCCISSTGDFWVLMNTVRGTSGSDAYLFQADAQTIGELVNEAGITNINIMYAYANKFGQTTLTTGSNILSFSPDIGPVNWTLDQYVTLGFYGIPKNEGIERINIYCTMDESTSPIFIGAIDIDPDNVQDYYSYNWYGSLSDTDEWSDANMKPDPENTTMGPDAEYCHMHDGRLYFWGSETKPYRLIIGGNPGHELSISRGLGGAYIDIEPGIGTVVHGTYKWKTTSGASIVTILCGNENTSTHKRFNLVENNITVDNELSEKSYMVEEISNTVGCQSNWGAGVWADGLYVLNRYGLTLTTMAMEYNSQIQSQLISDNVQPIFTDKLATLMDNARMIYADRVVYIVFGTENDPETLDRLILCYDVQLKAWYTFTYSDTDVDIRHLMNIDYKGAWEGLGLVCPDHVGFIPTTGSQDYIQENTVPFLIETGELSTTRPTQQTSYIAQLEFRFDYFIGDMDIDLEGVDYYGRRVHVHRHIHTDEVVNDFVDWMRVNCILENYNITMKGQARFRLTHFISKIYIESRKVGLTRGYDSLETYKNRRGGTTKIHHYIKNYANLRETILP